LIPPRSTLEIWFIKSISVLFKNIEILLFEKAEMRMLNQPSLTRRDNQ